MMRGRPSPMKDLSMEQLTQQTESKVSNGDEEHGCRRIPSRDAQVPPPAKARRVDRNGNPRLSKGDLKRKRKAQALSEAINHCDYYVDSKGLRRVRPYVYDFKTHAKQRWLGRTVVDVFSQEFGANPRAHHERMIRCGLLTVNGQKIPLDYSFKHGDLVCNRTHRHEPPVIDRDIAIVAETPEVVVVDKPCTIPVHPCGSYRFNTLFYILQRQRPDLLSLRVCHRLDRLTSGLVILAKTPERAGVIQTQIGSGSTRKTYLACVRGDFGTRLPPERRQQGSILPVNRGNGEDGMAANIPNTPNTPNTPEPVQLAEEEEDGEEPRNFSSSSGCGENRKTSPPPGRDDAARDPPASRGMVRVAHPSVEAQRMNDASGIATASGDNCSHPEGRDDDSCIGSGVHTDSQDGANQPLWWRYESLSRGEKAESGRSLERSSLDTTVAALAGESLGEGEDASVPCGLARGEVKTTASASAHQERLDRKHSESRKMAIRVNCPIRVLDPKDGVHECHAEGKDAQTVFEKVTFDPTSDTSIVRCTPIHGRTHQIRLHLQWINHPIANDPCYGGELFFGDPEARLRAEQDPATQGWRRAGYTRKRASSEGRAEGGQEEVCGERGVGGTRCQGQGSWDADRNTGTQTAKSGSGATDESASHPLVQYPEESDCDGRKQGQGQEQEAERVRDQGEQRAETISADDNSCNRTQDTSSRQNAMLDGMMLEKSGVTPKGDASSRKEVETNAEEGRREGEDEDAFMVRTCNMCQQGEKFQEKQLHCAGIWLHALSYEGPDWLFKTEAPPWARHAVTLDHISK